MAKLTLGEGPRSIEIDHQLERFAREAVRRASGGASDVLERRVGEFLLQVKEAWPRKTGKSAEAWEDYLRVSQDGGGDAVSAGLKNDTSYVFFIRSDQVTGKGVGGGDHAFTKLVRRPAELLADKMVDELGDVLVDRVGGL